MAIYLSHDSALDHWHAHRLQQLPAPRPTRVRVLHTAKGDAARARELVGALPPGEKLHLLVPSKLDRLRIADVESHVCTQELPMGSLCLTPEGDYVCSPELCFVQTANALSYEHTILLGFEMCGTYCTTPLDEKGFAACKPLTTQERLARFADKAKGLHGAKQARRALKHVVDGAASPMESRLAMLLCLPRSLGGYALPRPRLNVRIDIADPLRHAADQAFYVCDLYWPERRLDVEYDSDAFHANGTQTAHDSRRRTALEYARISVETVTRAELMNAGDFDRCAQAIAKRLHVPMPRPDHEFMLRQEDLRRALRLRR